MTPRELELLAQRMAPAIRRAFLQAVEAAQRAATIQLVTDLVAAGRVDALLEALGFDEARFSPVAEAIRLAFVGGAQAGIEELPALSLRQQIRGSYSPVNQSPVLRWSFDMRNPVAEAWLRDNSSRLITGIVDDQRGLIRGALQQGVAVGRNPRQTALDLVGRVSETGRRAGGMVGLTSQQAQFVANVRQQLASGDPAQMSAYFGRQRRDKRLDGIVSRAIKAGKPVAPADIEKIAGRYSDRLLALRGEVIARTESLTALNAGREESYRQQVEGGKVLPENIECDWSATGDERMRHSHAAMNGQKRTFGQPFQTPSGALMHYPGDTSLGAGPEETIQCRCMKRYQINMAAEVLRRGQQVR